MGLLTVFVYSVIRYSLFERDSNGSVIMGRDLSAFRAKHNVATLRMRSLSCFRSTGAFDMTATIRCRATNAQATFLGRGWLVVNINHVINHKAYRAGATHDS